MSDARRVTVFCGASSGRGGVESKYHRAARALGAEIASRKMGLVYGGGRAGLMGAVADGCLEAGGEVTGVITRLLVDRELGHTGITRLEVVETMHERKMMMAEMAHAFVALPGGLGTLDELFEILAWAQLGIHGKPVGILNTGGYYDSMMAFLDHVEQEGFLRLNHRTEIVFDPSVEGLMEKVAGLMK